MIREAAGGVLDTAEQGLYNARASLIGPFRADSAPR